MFLMFYPLLIALNDKYIFTLQHLMTFNLTPHSQTLNYRVYNARCAHDSTFTEEPTTYSSPEEQEFYYYYHLFWKEFEQQLYEELSRKDITDSSHPSFK